MPMFGFDEQYAYYGVTPVDNQFILEYLPNATGDAVRVYLYGLMQCYHPEQGMTIAQMARELSLEEEAVLAAYRYWERKGLVQRISNEPQYKYVSIKQLTMAGTVVTIDSEYERFSSAVSEAFGYDRELHGKDRERIYEWVDDLKLPMDVVIYLIKYMRTWRGKKVGIDTIERRAIRLADENVESTEDAERILNREKSVWDGCREVIKRFERISRYPSKDEEEMYRTWHVDWGFSHEDILAACAETTKGKPNFGYLNGIIGRLRAKERNVDVKAVLQQEKAEAAPLKKLLNTMNLHGVTVNEGTLKIYDEMRALYPDEMILLAGGECAKHGLGLDGVLATLESWKRHQVQTMEDAKQILKMVNDQYAFLSLIYDILGLKLKGNSSGRRLVQRWLDEWKFSKELVSECASWAIGAEAPMFYLNTVLKNLHQKNIFTVTAARLDHEKHRTEYEEEAKKNIAAVRKSKTVEQQQYTQREYVDSDDVLDAMMKKWQEENGNA